MVRKVDTHDCAKSDHLVQGRVYSLKLTAEGYRCPFEACGFVGLPGDLYKHGEEVHVRAVSMSIGLKLKGRTDLPSSSTKSWQLARNEAEAMMWM